MRGCKLTCSAVFLDDLQVQAALHPGQEGFLRLPEEKMLELGYAGGRVRIKQLRDDGKVYVRISSEQDAWVEVEDFVQAGAAPLL